MAREAVSLRGGYDYDHLQNGVVNAGDLLLSAISISTVTGALTFTVASGGAWVRDSTGALIRIAPLIQSAISPGMPALPGSGQYEVIGVEIDTTGTIYLVAGAATATQLNTAALIASNTPSVTAGRQRIADIAIWNNAGTYNFADHTTTATPAWSGGGNWTDRRNPAVIHPPLGTCVPYMGHGNPFEGQYLIADGSLVDKTVYSMLFARVGHTYNGNVDPGNNKMKIKDMRGKSSIGAINMGSAAGAGANDNAHAQYAQGASAGEINHILASGELPAHSHGLGSGGGQGPIFSGGATNGSPSVTGEANSWTFNCGILFTNPGNNYSVWLGNTDNGPGVSTGHNTVHPVETDTYLVRVA